MTQRSFSLGGQVAPPRFLLFIAAFIGGLALLAPSIGPARGTMLAFDVASGLFLILIAPLFWSQPGDVRIHARHNDANRALLLLVSVVVTLVVLAAVVSEMRAKSNHLAVALVVGTLVLAWLFSNTVYTLHYAHLFYLGDAKGADKGGIDFPDDKDGGYEPDYWDFAYFSFTLGMTFQTSDVEISSARIRRVVLGHCMAAFVFNIGVLALTINVLGSS